MQNTAKRREKAHRIAAKVDFEPTLTPETYTRDLIMALNWYNTNSTDKDRRKWVLQYLVSNNLKTAVVALNSATDFELRSLSFLCRLSMRGQELEEKDVDHITKMVKDLSYKYKKTKEIVVVKEVAVPKPSVQERMAELASTHAAEFDGAIDDFVKEKTEFSAKHYLKSHYVSSPVAKRIGEKYTRLVAELQEAVAGEDEQLVEGYKFLSKRELKKFLGFVESIVADCTQQVQSAKTARAPRIRKPQPASKITARVKFMKELPELGLKSVKPETIVGTDEVWVYNTKYRRVTVYKAESGTLSVRGTTILGFDVKESKTMTVRKPEEYFKGLAMGKRALGAAMKKLTSKPAVPNGRINEECIILGAF
jgi:hypothetical protein